MGEDVFSSERERIQRKGEPDKGIRIGSKTQSFSLLSSSESESDSRCVIKGDSSSSGGLEDRIIIGVGCFRELCATCCEVDAILLGDGDRSTTWGINGAQVHFSFDILRFLVTGDGDVGLLMY